MINLRNELCSCGGGGDIRKLLLFPRGGVQMKVRISAVTGPVKRRNRTRRGH